MLLLIVTVDTIRDIVNIFLFLFQLMALMCPLKQLCFSWVRNTHICHPAWLQIAEIIWNQLATGLFTCVQANKTAM